MVGLLLFLTVRKVIPWHSLGNGTALADARGQAAVPGGEATGRSAPSETGAGRM
jgi:hypothetical protein